MTLDELLECIRVKLAIKLFGDDLQVLKEKADEIVQVINRVQVLLLYRLTRSAARLNYHHSKLNTFITPPR